jgi:hypothetical protein
VSETKFHTQKNAITTCREKYCIQFCLLNTAFITEQSEDDKDHCDHDDHENNNDYCNNFNLDQNVGGWIILRWISERWDGVMWTGLAWLRIGTGGDLL